jgi:hypothetical protein
MLLGGYISSCGVIGEFPMKPLHDLRRCTLWLACSIALAPGAASAVTILESARSISIEWGSPPFEESLSAVDPVGYGEWSASLSEAAAGASQSSLIDPAVLSGGGYVASQEWYEYGATRYHVVFSVDSTTPYTLSVDNVDSAWATGGGDPVGSVRLRQVNPSDFEMVLQTVSSISLGRNYLTGEGFPDFSGEGVLAPGTYALDFLLWKGYTHYYGENGAAGFSFAVVPEPGTISLVLLGLIVLAGRRIPASGSR